MKIKRLIFYLIPVVIILGTLPFIVTSCATIGIEKVQYEVLEKNNSIEIREYKPYIIAETIVDSDFENAGNAAFGRLFNYISGDNQSRKSIEMTAPVNQRAESEKIAMTTPVTQQTEDGKYTVSFVMPSKYTMETIPRPTNDKIAIKEIPGFKAAVIRYSGTWSQQRYEQKKALLEKYIKENDLKPAGKPIWARYDPPFQLWLFRRNEVIIPIE